MTWRIYYGDGTRADGANKADWQVAPASGVQVVCVLDTAPTPLPDRFETGFVHCQLLRPGRAYYTGVDEYDPLGYGVAKAGSLIAAAAYLEIWDRAYADD